MTDPRPNGATLPVSRILLDLAENQLNDDELDALAAWLAADQLTAPPALIEQAARARASAVVTA